MRVANGIAIIGAALLLFGTSGVRAQCVDSLIVDAPIAVGQNTTVHIPVYARVCARADTGVTGVSLMFHNEFPGLYISSIEWNGPAIGEANTAINDYIGSPIQWAMSNVCSDSTCRGGVSLFVFMDITPSIPGGHHLLCWLVVQTGTTGSYALAPQDGLGNPQLINAFAFVETEVYPVLIGDMVNVVSHLSIIAPDEITLDENEQVCFDVTAIDADPSHEMTLTMLEEPSENATLVPDPNVGFSSITSEFCWTPIYCHAGVRTATFQVTCPTETVQWVTTFYVNNVNRPPTFSSSTPSCPASVPPNIPLTINIAFSDLDMVQCGDDELTLGYSGPGDSFVDNGDGTGTYQWTPGEADTGNHTVTFFADDLYGGHAEYPCLIMVGEEEQEFVRGDVQADDDYDIFDGIHLFNWLGGLAPWPACLDASDVDDDGEVDIFDGIRIFNWLGGLAPQPAPPFPSCGIDPTFDNVSCDFFPPCGFPGDGGPK